MNHKIAVLVLLGYFVFADSPDKIVEEDIKQETEYNETISPIKERGPVRTLSRGSARTLSRSTDFYFLKVDSSKNGYGAFLENNNPLAYTYDANGGGSDAGWVAVYRQAGDCEEGQPSQSGATPHCPETAGFLGAAMCKWNDDDMMLECDWGQRINDRYPEPGLTYTGTEPGQANLPTADGAPQARYPSGVVSSYHNKPTAVWNEYTDELTYGGGTYGGVPMQTFEIWGMSNPNVNFLSPQHLNFGCTTLPCDPPDLWNGNVQLIDANDGSVRLIAGYTSWADSESGSRYMIKSTSISDGIIAVDMPVFWQSDNNDSEMVTEDCLWYECTGYTGRPDFHINIDVLGYRVLTAFTYTSDTEPPYLRSLYLKKTEDYGANWTSSGGYKETGYHYISDDELIELSDSLYTLWSMNADDYPEKPWYPWAVCTDSTGTAYVCGDTINYSDDDSDFFLTPGLGLFYQYDVLTDQDGGIHFAGNVFNYVCKDIDNEYGLNGCDDNDGDGLADSIYSEFRFPGGGMYHFYNSDPIDNPDNWVATFIHDYSDAYSADWLGNMTLTYDAIQYFYPNISPSYEDGSEILWYGASNMSSATFNADTTLYEARDIDLYMAKSTDNGRSWWAPCIGEDGSTYLCNEPENVTNTIGQLEVGMHLANIGTDYDIGVFCQIPNFNVGTISNPAGYEDYMNYVYLGRYENDLESLSADNSGESDIIPAQFVLQQNYPNPFNPVTKISYSIDRASDVSLKLYDIKGRLVKTLLSNRVQAGSHDYILDASHLSTGVYFYTMTVNSVSESKKLVLMK